MKKTFKSLFLSMLAIAAFASCEKEPEGEGGGQKADGLTILAVTDGTLVPAWAAGDEIKVAVGSKSYDFTATTAGKSAKFTDDGSLTAELIGDNPVSAYYNCSSARGAFRISGEQTYRDGKSSAAIPMYAYTMNAPANNTLAMTFKPLASVLRVTLPVHPISVETITVRAAEGATVAEGAIAGTYVVNAAEGTVSVNADAESVEMTFATPLDITQGGTVDIPVGWFAVNGGLEIVLGYESTKEMKFVAGAEGTFKSYSDADGFKAGVVVPVEFEMDVNSFPRAYYVTATAPATGKGQSWSAPATLDYALTNAMAGSTIHVAAGTYNPTKALPYVSEEEIAASEALLGFEVKNNVTIIGGYPAAGGDVADASVNKTILDGNNVSNHVVVVGAAKVPGEKVVIEGITIQGGKNAESDTYKLTYGPEDSKYTLVSNYAAGLGIIATEVELKNVTVANNNGHSGAGLFASGSKIKMTGCTIAENKSAGNGAGAWFSAGNEIEIDGCTITKNDAGTAVVGGLYLHAPAEKSLTAVIRNTVISDNKAANQGGGYVRDDSGAHLLSASFENCTFSGNAGGLASCMHHLNANVTYSSCTFTASKGTSNGVVNIYDNCDIKFDKCLFHSNETTGGGGAIYAYTNADGATPKVTITNSAFYNNSANAKGTVWMRGDKGNVTLNCVNCTFNGNKTGNVGSAINLYKNVTANIVSCTIVGNTATYTGDANRAGAICLEAAPLTVNTYNSIIAGNVRDFDDAIEDVKVKGGDITHKYSFVGSDYYGAAGTVATVTPAFDYKTMLGALNSGVMKLIGAASANPAVGNGMPAADLKALTLAGVSADVLGKDQNGAERSGSIAGACITQ